MIDLIINGVSVDLSDSGISMLFQRQRTDYTNPTIVKNSFTKTIKLPSTKKNNILFDNIWKLTCACGKTRVLQAHKKAQNGRLRLIWRRIREYGFTLPG